MKNILILIALLTTPCLARKVLPSDDSRNVPGFQATRSALYAAVRNRDARFIYSLVRPQSTFSYGHPSTGRSALDHFYNLGKSDDRFWTTLEKILPLGGKWEQQSDTIAFPYFYNDSFPEAPERGVHNWGVIMGKDVILRSGPGKHHRAINKLSYEVMSYSQVTSDGHWAQVSDGGYLSGWVSTRYFHCPFWQRLILQRKNGNWFIESFVAGD